MNRCFFHKKKINFFVKIAILEQFLDQLLKIEIFRVLKFVKSFILICNIILSKIIFLIFKI